ncbi:MAG TPA: hypothetical protein QGG18_07280 [Rhodospirillales bacterium]|nr:hypothetical protein [Rhodospirillales bacterium]
MKKQDCVEQGITESSNAIAMMVAGLALYVVLFCVHEWIIGVSPLPLPD